MEGMAAVGLLAAIGVGFAFAYARALRRVGTVKLKAVEDQLDVVEREEEGIAEFESVGDSGDDDAVLQNLARRAETLPDKT